MSTFSLTDLSLAEVNVLLSGLGELPLKASLDTFGKVRAQIDQQMQAANAPVPVAAGEPLDPDKA